MHRISDPRMGGVSRKNLRMFGKLCGNDQLHHVRIVTTFWSQVDRKVADAREIDLATSAFKLLTESGAVLRRHDDTVKTARSILSELIIKEAVTTQVQKELNEGKKLGDTSAGVVITEEIVRLQQKHAKEMASLKKEMEEAAQKKNDALRAELAKEHRALEMKMERADDDRRRLEQTLNEAREDLKEEARKSQEMREKADAESAKFMEEMAKAKEERERMNKEMNAAMKKAEMDRQEMNRKAEEERKRHDEHIKHLRDEMKRADAERADMQKKLKEAEDKEKAENARMIERQTRQAEGGREKNEGYLRNLHEMMQKTAKDRAEIQRKMIAAQDQAKETNAQAAKRVTELQMRQATEQRMLAEKTQQAERHLHEVERRRAQAEQEGFKWRINRRIIRRRNIRVVELKYTR